MDKIIEFSNCTCVNGIRIEPTNINIAGGVSGVKFQSTAFQATAIKAPKFSKLKNNGAELGEVKGLN